MSPEDHAVDLITHWLTGQIDDDAIRAELSTEGLSGEGGEAVEELIAELHKPDASHGHLHMVARETVEALAMGG
jgi:tRNA A-37 threonylcarbamoyl transferase component Bud32